MNTLDQPTYTAFCGTRQVAHGDLREVTLKIKKRIDHDPDLQIITLNDTTGRTVDLDLHGTLDEVKKRLETPAQPAHEEKTGPGRPKLGVISREITLLPRHWEWLSSQPGGASVTLRKLVEEAKKKNQDRDSARLSQEATYRLMTVLAGDLPGYEEALRAFYAKDKKKFRDQIAHWPKDIREYILRVGCENVG